MLRPAGHTWFLPELSPPPDSVFTFVSRTVRFAGVNGGGLISPGGAGRVMAVMVLLFFLALLPILPSVHTYFGDEHFYTDGAIRMIRTGDYLTPTYPDGTLRFNKPVLTYWILAVNYKLFGISFFSSRVTSLVAGCLVILLGYGLARRLTGRQDIALLAGLMLLSNTHIFNASLRSIPDVFQCLFVTLSLYGFSGILFPPAPDRGPRRLDYVWAYVGAGLAVETKGLSGLLPVGFAFAFSALDRRGSARPRDLVSLPALLAGLAIASAWFVAVYVRHGDAALQGFLNDQVGERLSGPKTYVLSNVLEYSLGALRIFLPWTLLLAVLLPRSWVALRAAVREQGRAMVFALSWYLLLFVMFSSANIARTRYFLLGYPALASVLAMLIAALLERQTEPRGLAWLCWVMAVAGGFVGAGLAAVGAPLDWRVTAFGLLLLVLSGAWAGVLLQGVRPYRLPAIAGFVLLVMAGNALLLKPAFPTTPAPGLAEKIRECGWRGRRIVALGVPEKYLSQLRVLLKGEGDIQAGDGQWPMPARDTPLLIVSEERLWDVDADRHRIIAGALAYGKFRFRQIRRVMSADDPAAALEGLRTRYYLAVRAD